MTSEWNEHGKSAHLIDIRNTYPDFAGIVESVCSLTSGESSDMGLTLSMTGQVQDRVDCFKENGGECGMEYRMLPRAQC